MEAICCPVHGGGKLSVSRCGRWLACVVSGDSGVLVNWRWYACIWLLVRSSVACLSHSFKSDDHEWYWAAPSPADETWYRRNIDVLGREWYWSFRCRYRWGRGVSMSVSLVSALVSQLVPVYVSLSVSAVRERSPWLYVFVSVSGGFWHFFASMYWTSHWSI